MAAHRLTPGNEDNGQFYYNGRHTVSYFKDKNLVLLPERHWAAPGPTITSYRRHVIQEIFHGCLSRGIEVFYCLNLKPDHDDNECCYKDIIKSLAQQLNQSKRHVGDRINDMHNINGIISEANKYCDAFGIPHLKSIQDFPYDQLTDEAKLQLVQHQLSNWN